MVRFGYACINETLKAEGIMCNRGCILRTLKNKGSAAFDYLCALGKENLKGVLEILKWNVTHNIRFYRLSSKLFPHIGSKKIIGIITEEQWNDYLRLQPFKNEMKDIKKYASKNNIRLSVHPEHFCHLASPRKEVVENAIVDLVWHANLLDAVCVATDYNPPTICIHGGGLWGDKKAAAKRLIRQIRQLPDNVKSKICLENCEKSWSVTDLLPICKTLGIPLIFDFFHYECFSLLHPTVKQPSIETLLPEIIATWKTRRPKFHLSQQAPGKPIGAHSMFVDTLPNELVKLRKGYDLMLETKSKEAAVLQLVSFYLKN